MNSETGECIPRADNYSPPRMSPDWVEKEQSAALVWLAEGSAS